MNILFQYLEGRSILNTIVNTWKPGGRPGRANTIVNTSWNSIPPERVFSILNDTFDDDQESSLADYIEFSLQRQYNMRGRSRDDM